MYYTGIDEHKDNCFLTTVNAAGAVVKRARIQNEAGPDPRILSGISRTPPGSRGVHRQLVLVERSAGIARDRVMLAHAKYLKAIAYAKVKTDKVDSCTLAQLLRMDFIPQAYKIRPELRGLRDMMRARLRLIQRRTSSKNSMHRIGEKFNIANRSERERSAGGSSGALQDPVAVAL